MLGRGRKSKMADWTYKSVEQKVLEGPVGDFCGGLVKGVYAAIVTPFRFPTALRKIKKEQTFFGRVDSLIEFVGAGLGALSVPLYLLSKTNEVGEYLAQNEGDYTIPIAAGAVIAATNFASLCYEIGVRNGRKEGGK